MQIKQFLIAVCIGMMFAACSSKEDYTNETTKHPLRLSAGIKGMLTRSLSASNDAALQNDGFINGTQISVCPYGEHTDEVIAGDGFVPGSYITYTKGASGWTTSTNLYVLGSAQMIQARGVHPAKDASGNQLTWEETSFAVQSDQRTDENYRKSDLMFGDSPCVYPTEEIQMEFFHVFSKINIIVEDYSAVYTDEEFTNSTTGFYRAFVFNALTNATISFSNGVQKATGNGSTKTIEVCDNSSVDAICNSGVSCIIPPQTVTAGTEFIGISVNVDNMFKYIIPSGGLEFKGGYEYTFRLTLKKTGLSLSDMSVKSWEKESEYPISGDAK